MVRSFTLLAVLASVAGLSGLEARAQRLRIVIDSPDFRPYPIAVPRAVQIDGKRGPARRVARELGSLVQADVDLLRYFELVPPKSYLAPEKEPWTKPVYRNWLNVGASGLIRAGVEVDGDTLKVSFRFYDVVAQRELLFKSYETKVADFATPVHEFLDELIELLTGEPGIFSTKIAFVRRTPKGKAIYVSSIDGTGMQRITDAGQLSLLPAWDGSGKFLFFTSYMKSNPDLYRIAWRTGKMEWLSKKRGLNTGAAASPDGDSIALTLSVDGNTEIYLMDWNGKNLRRLTNSWGQDVSATWSPDGKRLAFVSSRSGQPHIYVMNVDGSDQRRLTFKGTYNQEPDWSPRADGKIVFTARDEKLMYDIFLVDPNSGDITRLTQDEGSRNESPSFSPDGHHIIFTSDRPPKRDKKLYIMDVDGRNQRRTGPNINDCESPAWGPRVGYEKSTVSR